MQFSGAQIGTLAPKCAGPGAGAGQWRYDDRVVGRRSSAVPSDGGVWTPASGSGPTRVRRCWSSTTTPSPQVYGYLLALTGGPAEPVVVPSFTVPDLASADAVRAGGDRTGDPSSGHDGRTADATDDQGAPFRLRQR